MRKTGIKNVLLLLGVWCPPYRQHVKILYKSNQYVDSGT